MSKIEIHLESPTVSSLNATAENCDKHASIQNAKTNPVEYFQSSEERYFFTTPNTGYYNSSGETMPERADCQSTSETYSDRLKGNIFAFSRRIVYKRSARLDSIIKRKKIQDIRKLAKYKHELKGLIQSAPEIGCKKRELIDKITTLRGSIRNCLSKTPTKLNTNMNKLFKGTIILTKSNKVPGSRKEKNSSLGKETHLKDVSLQVKVELLTNGESNSAPMQTKRGNKSRRKQLMVKYNIRPSLQRKHKKYFTYIGQAYKSPKRNLKRSRDYAKPEGGNSKPHRSPSPGLFMGKDSIYPAELNELFQPNRCNLCRVSMKSHIRANRHYISDFHNDRITNWCRWNYITNGVEPPKGRKYITKFVYPRGFYCLFCRVKIPSSRHALQHFNSKGHRRKVTSITPLTGIGYFNCEGKWIETGKVIDESTGKESAHVIVKTSTGIEPVVLHHASKTSSATEPNETCLNGPIFEEELLEGVSEPDKVNSDEHECSENKAEESIVSDQENSLEETFEEKYSELKVCNENTIEESVIFEQENLFDDKFEVIDGEGQLWSEIKVEEAVVSEQENRFEVKIEDTHGDEQVCSENTAEESVISEPENCLREEPSIRKPKLTVRNIQLMMEQEEFRPFEVASLLYRPEHPGINSLHENTDYEHFNTTSDSSGSNLPNSPVDQRSAEEIELMTFYSQHAAEGMQTPRQAMDTLTCILCNIKATSKKQMFCHLKGSRHSKKMLLVGETPQPFVTVADSLLLEDPEDLSIYRTPSGSYYCDACKINVSTPERISNHIASKRHFKVTRRNRKSKPDASK